MDQIDDLTAAIKTLDDCSREDWTYDLVRSIKLIAEALSLVEDRIRSNEESLSQLTELIRGPE